MEVSMSWLNKENKFLLLKVFLFTECVFLLFWWPLSHWFYPVFYHTLLGFQIGSYQDSMVKVIGSCGFVLVLLLLFSALNPVRNKDMLLVLIIFSFLIAFTYIFLIISKVFPIFEIVNVGLSLATAVIIILLFPHENKKT